MIKLMNIEEARPHLSVIVPAYNEGKRIGNTLASIYNYLSVQPFTWEVLVVLDGSQDNTLEVTRQFAQGKEHIRWIYRRENRGKGYTVREGMLAAKGDIRLFTDADNSTDISHFDQMKPLFERGAQIVICSRDSKDAPGARQAVPQPPLKRFLGNAGNLLIQIMAVPGIWDTRCGFKAFRKGSAQKIFSLARMDGWSIDDEALALARHFGYKIHVVAANWVNAEGTHVRKIDYLKNIWDALKIRWQLMSGFYDRPRAAADPVIET
jgi:glycosyltransferase involved in cell wall biosynthesis